MSAADVFLVVVRWLHLVTAAVWVGGSIFYLLVRRPASRRNPDAWAGIGRLAAAEFQTLVDGSIVVLVLSGAILTFDRLTGGIADATYVITLAVKIVLSVWMIALVRLERRRRAVPPAYREERSGEGSRRWRGLSEAMSGYNAITILGIAVFLLSDILKVLFENALSR